jgi:LacI family transcriptional regulator
MTLEEVARRAGVSTATVSRVLNSSSVVREATRKRVLEAAKELKYHPNLHARSLAGAKTRTLGVIVSNIENPFFIDVYCALEATALLRGYDIIVEQTGYKPARLLSSVRSMVGRRVEGLAVIVSEMENSLIQEINEVGIPSVFYDVGQPGPRCTCIRVRYERGMQRTIEYLYALGHRRMAFVGHHVGLVPLQERKRSFLCTVARYGDAVQHATILGHDGPAGGRQAVTELLRSGFRPTAILCVNDFMAIGVLRELRDRGIRVPEDVSVTGFDNIQLSEMVVPSLTTANIPRRRIGQLAFEALVNADGATSENGHEYMIDPELVLRESTGPAKH